MFVERMMGRPGTIILNLGSKSINLGPNVLNLDICAYPGVHAVGDGHHLPFRDGSVGGVVITSVLEHVAVPSVVVCEVARVLRVGGEVYAEVPFMQPFHPDPRDYQRYTVTGLDRLFEDFEITERGVCVGPHSALAWILSEYVAIMLCLGSHWAYKLLVRAFRIIFTPLIWLDFLFERNPYSLTLASSYFLVGLKKSTCR
jgi:SAM-dependent methyltransferase